jgi:hypothetical protein
MATIDDKRGQADAEHERKLKVMFPYDMPPPSKYLDASRRFKSCKLFTFEELRKFLSTNFKVNFEVLVIGQDDIISKDLEHHDYIAFISVKDPSFGSKVRECAEFGIPVVFVRHDPTMQCDLIDTEDHENRCFQNRLYCGGNRGSHCEGSYFKNLIFREQNNEATIPSIATIFDINEIPIFSMTFLIDFLIWYGTYGLTLQNKRDDRISDKANREYLQKAVYKAIAQDLSHRIT